MSVMEKLGRRSRSFLMFACLGFLALVGLVDFLTGFEIFFSVFYLLAVGVATWFVGTGFGLFMSVLSAAAWITGDLAAGAHYSSPFIPIWNTAILLAFYCIVVWLLASLRGLHKELENRVRQRTIALTQEMAERQRLEEEILEVSEREQRRIGRDLHDNLCQHLTGTALAGRVLEEKLAARSLAEAADAGKIVELVEDGITLARNLARGIAPVEMDAEGLRAAFQELAANVTRLSRITCVFDCDARVLIHDAATATHLYRIVQEAVGNAMRHGKPRRIDITLTERNGRVTLTVEDDGAGLPEKWQKNQGLGARIMAHRAAMIGGTFSIEPNPTGGTSVKCLVPAPTEKPPLPTPTHQ
jgi:signal transduction histidine kinase